MNNIPKLFLYSMSLTGKHYAALEKLTGKKAKDIYFACIENAADVIEGSEQWVPGTRQSLADRGYHVESIDLRNRFHKPDALYEKLQSKDVIWVCGGHTYYLRWILKESGADRIIKELVAAGKVYAGWSAGAIMAGPTTKYFELMGDDPVGSPEIITEGLNLTDKVIVPHMDNPDFAEGAAAAVKALGDAGFKAISLNDHEAYVIHGDTETLI
jgi:dipeptidase E